VRRFDCELKEVFEAAIPQVSHDRRVMFENTPSLQSDADSLREFKRSSEAAVEWF
jgi:hypothetical protein